MAESLSAAPQIADGEPLAIDTLERRQRIRTAPWPSGNISGAKRIIGRHLSL
jgi:hypothetical protein